MKKLLLLLGLLFVCLTSCQKKDNSIEKIHKRIQNYDFNEFKNCHIFNRKGTFYIKQNNREFKVTKSIFSNRIKTISEIGSNEPGLIINDTTKMSFEKLIVSFNKLGALSVEVDSTNNVYLSFPLEDRCTYYFLKLSDKNSLLDLKKGFYKNYSGDWYLDKECSN